MFAQAGVVPYIKIDRVNVVRFSAFGVKDILVMDNARTRAALWLTISTPNMGEHF